MDLAGGGELAKYIINQKSKRTSEGIQDTACSVKITQFYIAELILALEYLHINDIIHMDLKPESTTIQLHQIYNYSYLIVFIFLYV